MSSLTSDLQELLPLISVVIPAYNRLPLLRQAVASVQAQTYTGWELIIADDGSTDGTKEMIRSLQDDRIKLLSLPHCGNVAVLRNAGVAAATGEWVAFLDSDDVWVAEKLAIQLRSVQYADAIWSYGGAELMNEAGQTIPGRTGKYQPLSGWITKELLTNKASVSIGTLLLKRKLFEELNGFDTDARLIFREDYEFALRLSGAAEAAALPQLLVRVREHNNRSTNTLDDPHERTAFLYGHFAKNCPDKKFKKIALKRQAYHITETAAKK